MKQHAKPNNFTLHEYFSNKNNYPQGTKKIFFNYKSIGHRGQVLKDHKILQMLTLLFYLIR